MTRFYFHIVDGEVVDLDSEGVDLPSAEHARDEALVAARGILADAVLIGEKMSTHRYFKVTDARGNIVAVVPFREAVHE